MYWRTGEENGERAGISGKEYQCLITKRSADFCTIKTQDHFS